VTFQAMTLYARRQETKGKLGEKLHQKLF